MRGRAPDLHRRPLVPERREETQALEMVEVQMRQAEVHVSDAAALEVEAERPDARTGVQHERNVLVEFDLDAGGVASVRDGVGPRCRNGAAATPDREPHALLLPPEDRDDADELLGVCKERERSDGDVALDTIGRGDAKRLVRRPLLVERDAYGPALRR